MATNTKTTGDFPLPRDGYLTFDSLSLKAYLKQRLIDNGVFTDSAYEGSNVSQIIDVMAFTFNNLIYYLNRSSADSLFSDSQEYENMNRIVKTIGYNPIGRQSSLLSFTCSANANISTGLWTIPRYSYITLGSVAYSFDQDITIFKSTTGVETMTEMSDNNLLYQGRFIEYPIYNATGDEGEIVYLNPGKNVLVDHFNVDIYIKDINIGTWTKWEQSPSLYLETALANKYEIRLNDQKNYEIKFGNNINGKKLNANDTVAIYYLKTDGATGEVGVNALRGGKVVKYQTTQFNAIYQDIQTEDVTLLSDTDIRNLEFDNQSSSTYYSPEESVDSIRYNAPSMFRSQHRLVTESDFENYVKTNFSNLIHDVRVANNWSYLSNYLKYFYDNGITDPNNIGRVLYNQVNFADSCNFNNVYMFVVPKVTTNTTNPMSYLNASLKSLIISSMQDVKLLTAEIITIDPVFMGFDVAISKTGVTPSIDDISNSELYIVKQANSRRDITAIQKDINNIFVNYFTRSNCNLGQTIDINTLTNEILSVVGVETIYTRRTDDTTIRYEGLSMLTWNPIYPTDIKYITQNLTISYFQFPFLNDSVNFVNKINVQTTYKTYENIEY
jgi:hypothetical protein